MLMKYYHKYTTSGKFTSAIFSIAVVSKWINTLEATWSVGHVETGKATWSVATNSVRRTTSVVYCTLVYICTSSHINDR